MARTIEYLIGGILCLIIAIVAYFMFHRISASTFVGVGLFIYGAYRFIVKR